MKTIIQWTASESEQPPEGAVCLVVHKPGKHAPTGDEAPAGIVNGLLKWENGKWDHPERQHMHKYGRVRQDISHWCDVATLTLDEKV